MGSTIVTLELADELRSRGASVVVYAAFVGEPAAAAFRDHGIDLLDEAATSAAGITLDDFDLVWVNSQVLPLPVVDSLMRSWPSRLPVFVFHHMSPLDYAPDEHPYLHGLEERLASLSTFISPATRDELLPFFSGRPPTDLFSNPAPRAFARSPYVSSGSPERILVVSNHVTPEVEEAKALLRDKGLEVVHFGSGQDEYALVTAEVLDRFDVVVTIGKTVQYCLVAGRPVYVYDHFGGQG
ncbi:hypothetical protein HMPREF0063_12323 [Aeromicrobium marinum DSM 15272]|uniref:Glycosyltransferase subfamily 4-like N-terminal domain-containing protein n=1 Tax=Aeromicrobium marinum DSM 15272 TaxID=585531 RepID=E2SD11_9ACTN|nr:hypothetical protein HMPREF0063_12323 [Aeromicrobium marinum DSM 15272]